MLYYELYGIYVLPVFHPSPLLLGKPLPLDGFQGTPDEVEQQWYDQVYLGSGDRMKQLTWRAVIVGMLLGSILSLTNLYANLKMGWSFGVALTAGIISFALWNAFVRLGISKSPMTILEIHACSPLPVLQAILQGEPSPPP